MRKMSFKEYQEVLLDILEYIDKLCRKNNINYSLIGGSLIGAIREKKILSWDDDIDIILTVENYQKLERAIKSDNNNRYLLLNNNVDNNYPFPFSKLIDTQTVIEQKNQTKIENYGAFVDIFTYHNVPNNRIIRYFHLKKIDFYKKMINGLLLDDKFEINQSIIKKIRNKISKKIGAKRLVNWYDRTITKYDDKKCNYIVSNWMVYPLKKELQLKENMMNYKYVDFSNLKILVTKDYDKILTTTFGNYMIPPKDSDKVTHDINAYWRT